MPWGLSPRLPCKDTVRTETIVFGLTGTGYFDMLSYGKYNDGVMQDYVPPDDDLVRGYAGLPKI